MRVIGIGIVVTVLALLFPKCLGKKGNEETPTPKPTEKKTYTLSFPSTVNLPKQSKNQPSGASSSTPVSTMPIRKGPKDKIPSMRPSGKASAQVPSGVGGQEAKNLKPTRGDVKQPSYERKPNIETKNKVDTEVLSGRCTGGTVGENAICEAAAHVPKVLSRNSPAVAWS